MRGLLLYQGKFEKSGETLFLQEENKEGAVII